MKFYRRLNKNDFVQSNISVKIIDNTFELSWYKAQQVVNFDTQKPELVYPGIPTVSEILHAQKILLEKKTNLPLDNPHQVIACGVSEETGKFVFVDLLKYTFVNKGSTGAFKMFSNIQPIMYAFVPFPDTPISQWTFVLIGNSITVDGVELVEEIDIDINRTIATACSEHLPGINITKNGNVISAQVVNINGVPVQKDNIDIYFETTAGYLTRSRSKTNVQGIATTELIGALEGKVKAGFKYFSGKTELTI